MSWRLIAAVVLLALAIVAVLVWMTDDLQRFVL